MNKKQFNSEKHMGEVFIQILEKSGFEYWCEVECHAGVIDVVALKDNTYYTFHLKLRLSNKVLEQASRCHIYNTRNYVIIPHRKNYEIDSVQNYFLSHHNIGIFEIEKYAETNLDRIENYKSFYLIPFLNIRKHFNEKQDLGKVDISKFLFDSQKDYIPGSADGRYDTSFKRSLKILLDYFKENEYKSLKETWAILKDQLHWYSLNSMQSALCTLQHLDIVKEVRNVMMDKKKLI